jgi:Fuc2NAc and GlcNAc transferase
MDGIDGIASVQTISVCAGIALLVWLTDGPTGSVIGPLVLAAAVGGFLVWNWPPARIFMGDVGSGYLGFMTAAFIVVATAHDARLMWGAIVLSGAFVVDATVTLFLRAARRERLFQAHRSHAYQRLAIRWGSHRAVTLLCLAVNLGWLLPIASLVALRHVGGEIGLLVAWVPLAAGVLWVNHTE